MESKEHCRVLVRLRRSYHHEPRVSIHLAFDSRRMSAIEGNIERLVVAEGRNSAAIPRLFRQTPHRPLQTVDGQRKHAFAE